MESEAGGGGGGGGGGAPFAVPAGGAPFAMPAGDNPFAGGGSPAKKKIEKRRIPSGWRKACKKTEKPQLWRIC